MEGKADSNYDMPMGLSFQLGMNPKAMDVYGKLNDEEKRRVVEAARNVTTKSEMRQIVAGLEQNFC